jgi:hypothetical protein
MSLRDLISKTTIANIVAAVIVIGGLAYAFWQRNTDLIYFLAGAGVGYLFKGVVK